MTNFNTNAVKTTFLNETIYYPNEESTHNEEEHLDFVNPRADISIASAGNVFDPDDPYEEQDDYFETITGSDFNKDYTIYDSSIAYSTSDGLIMDRWRDTMDNILYDNMDDMMDYFMNGGDTTKGGYYICFGGGIAYTTGDECLAMYKYQTIEEFKGYIHSYCPLDALHSHCLFDDYDDYDDY